MTVNYAAYDRRKYLSLSEAGHLWVEMTPVARRDGIAHPGPADKGWKFDFWRWLKDHILDTTGVKVTGAVSIERRLYLAIAQSKEYAGFIEVVPQLKERPLFLFPTDRTNSGSAKYPAEGRCKKWLISKMNGGKTAKEKSKSQYFKEAKKKFECSKPQFERAWSDACKETGSEWDSGGRPRLKKPPKESPQKNHPAH